MKKAFRYLHLWLGLTSGLVVFIVAASGCIYAFEKEIKALVYKDLLFVKEEAVSRPVDELLDLVKRKHKKPGVKTIFVTGDPKKSIQFILKNKISIYVDPYTGTILGEIDHEKSFFGIVLRLHRGLLLGEVGKKITGISALTFLFMLVSGIILWWPKNKKFTLQKFSLKKNASPKRLNYDLHSVLGFYASWIIIFTVLTGLIWSFKWAENTMYWLSGSVKEKKQYHSVYSDSTSFKYETILANCKAEFPKHQEIVIVLPEDSISAIRFNLTNNSVGFFKDQHQLYFDCYTGKLIKANLFESNSTGEKLRVINYDIHTGKIFGLTGQLLVFFAALITASLPISGFILWRNKRKKNQIFFKE